MNFEWDEAKRLANIRKHELDFKDAAKIFQGLVVTIADERKNYGEERFVTLGMLNTIVIYIAHTERANRIRIISMRKATKNETSYYFDQVGDEYEAPEGDD